jgi:hypothetical protein
MLLYYDINVVEIWGLRRWALGERGGEPNQTKKFSYLKQKIDKSYQDTIQ